MMVLYRLFSGLRHRICPRLVRQHRAEERTRDDQVPGTAGQLSERGRKLQRPDSQPHWDADLLLLGNYSFLAEYKS